jgi:hypothetical protein
MKQTLQQKQVLSTNPSAIVVFLTPGSPINTRLFFVFLDEISMLELIIIIYNMYGLICNKYILYNGLSNYTRNEVIKFCIGFIICH